MREGRLSFVKENYEEIQNILKMRDEYFEYLRDKGSAALDKVSGNGRFRQHNWGDKGVALRFSSPQWGEKAEVAWIVKPNGSFDIIIYVYEIDDSNIERLNKYIDPSSYQKHWVESGTIRCFRSFDLPYEELENALKNAAERLNDFYQSE